MKKYYITQDNAKKGPYILEDLKNISLFSDTLVWTEGFENWKSAAELPELQDYIQSSPPPIPTSYEKTTVFEDDFVPHRPKHDYSQVEDIAGVDYKKAMTVTGIFLALNLLFKHYTLGITGSLATGILPIMIWIYFKKYFLAVKDKKTAKLTNWIAAAYVIHFFTFFFVSEVDWVGLSYKSLVEVVITLIVAFFSDKNPNLVLESTETLYFMVQITGFCSLLSFIGILVAAVQLILANKNHPFPLKRIAVSAVIAIPLWMMTHLGEGVLKDIETGLFFNAILMLPYFFLLHHFYRAEMDDATP